MSVQLLYFHGEQGFLILWYINHAFVRLVELQLNDLLSFIK